MRLSVTMRKYETVLGWFLVLLHLLILPFGLVFLNEFLANPFSITQLNLVTFVVVFIFAMLIFRRYLKENLRIFMQNIPSCLLTALAGFGIYWVINLAVTFLILLVDPEFANVNDSTISGMMDGNYLPMAIAISLLVPVSEECMFRGLLFQGMLRFGRPAAYILSILCFAAIHVVGYIGTEDILNLGLCFLQYLPAGFALAWAYEKTDSICTSILIHMAVNLIGVSAMR